MAELESSGPRVGSEEAETFPINVTMKGKGGRERLGWLDGGGESLLFAAGFRPGRKDPYRRAN